MENQNTAKTILDLKERESLWVKTNTGIGRSSAWYPNIHWRNDGVLTYSVTYYDHKDSFGDYPFYPYEKSQVKKFTVIEEPLQSKLEQAHQAYEAALETFEELIGQAE